MRSLLGAIQGAESSSMSSLILQEVSGRTATQANHRERKPGKKRKEKTRSAARKSSSSGD